MGNLETEKILRKTHFVVDSNRAEVIEAGIDQLSLAGIPYDRKRDQDYRIENKVLIEVSGEHLDPVRELYSSFIHSPVQDIEEVTRHARRIIFNRQQALFNSKLFELRKPLR